jgi:HAD superfamily hydrolase (TIGR01490 family)
MKYGEGVSESAPPRGAKSVSGAAGSASSQAGAAQKPFAVFDIDGTLIRWQLYHAIADSLAQRGHIKADSYRAMRDARMAWKKRGGGFKDYEKQVIVIYEAVLQTLSFAQLQEAIDGVFDEYKDQVYTYTRDLIAELKQKDYLLFAISGSQSEIVAKIANYYGFDDYIGTVYERTKTSFSGQKTIGSFEKDKTLKQLVKKHGASWPGSLAIGDSHSDTSMLDLVEQPIALNPDIDLFKHAEAKGWKVVIERKNMVYQLEIADGKYQLAKTNS